MPMRGMRLKRHISSPSLSTKLLMLLTGIGLGGSLAIVLLLANVITPSFDRLERAAIDAQVERMQAALRATAEPSSAELTAILHVPTRVDPMSRATEVIVNRTRETIEIAVPVVGADGRPVAAARFALPRDLSILGRRMLVLAVGGAIILLTILLVALRRMIGRLVLAPLNRVEHHMGVVRASGSLALLPDDRRPDEIGSLVTSFNAMLRQLTDLREQVEMQSFKLGQSENAIAVMHNVRNALNPVSTILSQDLASTPIADAALLDRALAELAGDGIPLARRQKLAAFVVAAAHADAADRERWRNEIAAGRIALHNVLEIIGRQQEQAHRAPTLSACDLSDIVARNAAIAQYSADTSIAFVFPSRPHWAMANRVILSQVIGNLLANAGEAIAARGNSGSITVTITETGDTVQLAMRDDGEGIAPDLRDSVFQRGFSTRAHKSGGLGLHWCANVMLAMGGSLQLDSDGMGCGACAVLTLKAPAAGMISGALAA